MEAGAFDPADYVALFFELFQRSSDPVLLAHADDGTVIDANESFLSLFDLTRSEAVGRTTDELGLSIRLDDLVGVADLTQPLAIVEPVPVRARNRWSEEFTVALSTVRLPWRGEEVVLAVGRLVSSRRPSVLSDAARGVGAVP